MRGTQRSICLTEFQARFPQGPDGTYGCDTTSNPHYTTWGTSRSCCLQSSRSVGCGCCSDMRQQGHQGLAGPS